MQSHAIELARLFLEAADQEHVAVKADEIGLLWFRWRPARLRPALFAAMLGIPELSREM